MRVAASIRSLQSIYVPEQGSWVFVWAINDGDLDRNLRLAYGVASSPAEFQPSSGQFILTLDTDASSRSFVYGVPYKMQVVQGVVKVYFVNLSPALGQPRFALGEETPDFNNAGKSDAKPGWCLEGQFSREGITAGPILWNLKDQSIVNNPFGILEVSDVDKNTLGITNGPPGGTICIEYQRDQTGRVIVDEDGSPQIAFVDDTLDEDELYTAQNYKIGYLGLQFIENYFGIGMHGWLAANPDEVGPFDLISLGTDGKLYLHPGTVNQLIPDNPFDAIDCSGNDTTYVSLRCRTEGQQINQAEYQTQSTPFKPPAAVKGAAPSEFDVTLYIVVRTGTTYTAYKTWPKHSNINATPTPWITTDRDNPQPGQLLTEQWWTWQAVAANAPSNI